MGGMKRTLSPTAVLPLGFLWVILVGGLLLMLPVATADGAAATPLTALFTATSATCVTGLSTVVTATYWSWFGKGVILLLIQIGGLGFMSLTLLFSLVLRRKVSPRERLIFAQSMNLPGVGEYARFLRRMFAAVFACELGGALLLAIRLVPLYGWGKGIWYAVFHAVSAFCNAGFDLFGDSLIGFAGDGYVLGVISLLIVAGGLGFGVWDELMRRIFRRERLSLYARMVLVTTGVLLAGGTLLYLAAEWNHAPTLGTLSAGEKVLNAFFQSVTMRTAGFASVPHGGMRAVSLLISMLLMFVGGSSGSTAGGIKTGTFAVLLVAAVQILKGSREVRLGRRWIPHATVSRAFALAGFAGVTVFGSVLLLSFTEPFGMGALAYEVVSAFGTVGVSTGITAQFSAFGQCWLMLLMFLGRLGLASVTYAVLLSFGREKTVLTYPRAEIQIG